MTIIESMESVTEDNLPLRGENGLAPANDLSSVVPELVAAAEPKASEEYLNFFLVSIRNLNTRAAYGRAVHQFLSWSRERMPSLESVAQIRPLMVAGYIENHSGSPQTVKQHLAAIKGLFAWLHSHGAIESNPATSVKGPSYSYDEGKTPSYAPHEVRRILDGCDTKSVFGLRDKAFIAVMAFTFARVSAVCNLKREDYVYTGGSWHLRFKEKGGKERLVPVHHELQQHLDSYLDKGGIEEGYIFRAGNGNRSTLSERKLERGPALTMVKRRAMDAEIEGWEKICNHSFRASGITTFMGSGGALEEAQKIAGHASPRTTKLYDHTPRQVMRKEVERIRYE